MLFTNFIRIVVVPTFCPATESHLGNYQVIGAEKNRISEKKKMRLCYVGYMIECMLHMDREHVLFIAYFPALNPVLCTLWGIHICVRVLYN